jgi:hypothetical protein
MSNKVNKPFEEASSLPEAETATEESTISEAIVPESGARKIRSDIEGKDPTIKNN